MSSSGAKGAVVADGVAGATGARDGDGATALRVGARRTDSPIRAGSPIQTDSPIRAGDAGCPAPDGGAGHIRAGIARDRAALIPESVWRERQAAHESHADALTAEHRARRLAGEKHPVEDFLWTYYSLKPGELRRWHPGAGAVLENAARDRADWKHYSPAGAGGAHSTVDVDAFFARRGRTVDYIERLLRETMGRAPRFGCFGLHEWAMVYRMTPEQLRHTQLPLRIGHEATDRVVEEHPITCTHFDAYRFFTPEAEPLNELRPTRDTQIDLEQPGCLHAGMDLYKWAAKLGPIVPGEVLLDAFVLSRDIREVDMRASPYDVSAFAGANGERLEAIPIETPAGKREYAALQRVFAERGNALRRRVLDAIAVARGALA